MAKDSPLVPAERIEQAILLIRGAKVLLDADLAKHYRVTTFNLNKAVKRNLQRSPQDFMFQRTREESDRLRFQSGMSKPAGRGGRRYLPYAFTEQGVAMLSSVLRSKRAIEVNIAIIRALKRKGPSILRSGGPGRFRCNRLAGRAVSSDVWIRP